MALTVQDVYNAALAVMGEENDDDYRSRTPDIINTLLGKVYPVSELFTGGTHSGWTRVYSMTDELVGIDQSLALAAMPFGLGALLILDEDTEKADSFWTIFTRAVETFKNSPVEFEAIEDVYRVTDEYGEFSRWG